ncbi:MAG: N-acetyl-gamma-glutamyl-phosphate reductase, partial [Clostridia bacterium]|nr:N-acetyl-gamma-glutamyl-phosphate reductase [Clostridia bacterium]
PRYYALSLSHKHLPEMQRVCTLGFKPIFTPAVGDFRRGMLVTVPLFSRMLRKKYSAGAIRSFYGEYYRDAAFVSVMPSADGLDAGFLDATACNGTNRLELFVFGDAERILVAARLDNLGKGASGAAVQCMNLMLGLEETAGLL